MHRPKRRSLKALPELHDESIETKTFESLWVEEFDRDTVLPYHSSTPIRPERFFGFCA
jgi:hypothetical protein